MGVICTNLANELGHHLVMILVEFPEILAFPFPPPKKKSSIITSPPANVFSSQLV